MLYGDTLTLIKQKITNIVVFESICNRPKGVCLSGVEWGYVRVGFGPSGVMSSGVMSEWGFVQWGYVRLPYTKPLGTYLDVNIANVLV